MDSNTFLSLTYFRRDLYACFLRAGDVLMNTVDALLSETNAQSLVELSLSPAFERRWSSLYDAFDNAKIDRNALRTLLVRSLPPPPSGRRRVFGVDASSIARPLCMRRRRVHCRHSYTENTFTITPASRTCSSLEHRNR